MGTPWKNMDHLQLNEDQLSILKQTLDRLISKNLLNDSLNKEKLYTTLIEGCNLATKNSSFVYTCNNQHDGEVNVDVEATRKQYQYKENEHSKFSQDGNSEFSGAKKAKVSTAQYDDKKDYTNFEKDNKNFNSSEKLLKEESNDKPIKKKSLKKHSKNNSKLTNNIDEIMESNKENLLLKNKLSLKYRKKLKSKESKIPTEVTHYINQAIMFSKHGFIILKNVLFYLCCLILMITILLLKMSWYLISNLLRFMLLFFILAVLWCYIKINQLWCFVNSRYNIWNRIKRFFSVSVSLIELLIGIDLSKFVKKKVPDNKEEDTDEGLLPNTSQEAIQHLLKQKENRPFKTLCVNSSASGEMVKSNYRNIARLVHPDKCDDPSAAEAFKILDAAFKKISDDDARCKQNKKEEMERQQEELSRHYENSELKNFIDELMNSLPCTSCGGKHRKTLQENRVYTQGRYCGECKESHLANDGDVWAETNSFGVSWVCYACFNKQIYELTEWAKCNKLHHSLHANMHQVFCRLGTLSSRQQNRRKCRENESSDSSKTKHKKGKKSR